MLYFTVFFFEVLNDSWEVEDKMMKHFLGMFNGLEHVCYNLKIMIIMDANDTMFLPELNIFVTIF